VQDISKKITELNKAHDVFLAEFPDAKSDIPKDEPEPEVPQPEEQPAEEPAPAAQPPAEAPAAAPAPAPATTGAAQGQVPAESIEKALEDVKAHKDYALVENLLQRGESYATIASVIKDICPTLKSRQIYEVIHKLV
jgi:hypothetical protein